MENELLCDVCGLPIDYENEEFCWDHEEDCPRKGNPDSDAICYCNVNYHAGCCPECNAKDGGDGEQSHPQD